MRRSIHRLQAAAALGAVLSTGAFASEQASTPPTLLQWSHFGLEVATLVPVTEASIWASNCQPASREAVVEVVRLAQSAQSSARPTYNSLNVRAAVLAESGTLFVSEGLGLKFVTANVVRYLNPTPTSQLALAIYLAFKQCTR